MKPIDLPTYDELDRVLSQTTLKLHPSQVHGLICGILCGNVSGAAAWESLVTGDGKENPETHALLLSLHEASAKQLNDFLLDFQIVLPTDSEALPVRAEALTLWCQGILTGLKMAQIPIVEREPGDLTEAINDLVEIAKMNYEEVVANEEDEAAYTELVEYIRMAVIYIYQDLHEKQAPISAKSTSKHLH